MLICGIDPGTRVVGVSFVTAERPRRLVAAEAIRLERGQPLGERLCVIESRLADLIAATPPDEIAIERIFQGRNVASLIGLGEGRGVALLVAARTRMPIHEYSPAEVKKSITGHGGATKDQVAKWVRAEISGIPEGAASDVTDAIAIALCHAERLRVLRFANGDPRAASIEGAATGAGAKSLRGALGALGVVGAMRGRPRRGRGR